jgi:hypothetical protein
MSIRSLLKVATALALLALASPVSAQVPVYAPQQSIDIGGLAAASPSANATTMDSKGRVIVANAGQSTIEVYQCNAAGTPCSQIAHYGAPGDPHWFYSYQPPPDGSTIDAVIPVGIDSTMSCERVPGQVPRLPACLAAPQGVAVDAADRIYVADTGNYRVLVFQSADNHESDGTLKLLYAFGTFAGTVVDVGPFGPNGPLLDANGNFIQALFFQPTPPAPDHFAAPFDLAVYKKTGQVFVLDQSNNQIQGFTPPCDAVSTGLGYACSGGTFTQFVAFGHRGDEITDDDGLVFPTGIGLDQTTGDIALADSGRHRAVVYTYPFTDNTTPPYTTGTRLSAQIHTAGPNGPDVFGRTVGASNGPALYQVGDVAIDRAHRLFVLDSVSAGIHVFTRSPAGAYVFQFTIQKQQGILPGQLNIPASIDLVQPGDPTDTFDLESDPLGQMVVADTNAGRVQVFRHARMSTAVTFPSLTGSLDTPIPATITVTNNGPLPLIGVAATLVSSSVPIASFTVLPGTGTSLAPSGDPQGGDRLQFAVLVQAQSSGALNLQAGAAGKTHFVDPHGRIDEENVVATPSAPGSPVNVGCGVTNALILKSATANASVVQSGGSIVLHVTLNNCSGTALQGVSPSISVSTSVPGLIPNAATVPSLALLNAADTQSLDVSYNTAPNSNGTATFVVSATAAGGVTAQSPITASVTISADVTPPVATATITPPPTDGVNIYRGIVSVQLKATDNGPGDSGIAALQCSYVVASFFGSHDCSSQVTGNPPIFTAQPFTLPDGEVTLTYCAVDAAIPSPHQDCHVAKLVIDNTPPFITWSISSSPNAAGWHNSPFTAFFVADDNLTKIAHIQTSIAPTFGTTFVFNDLDAVFSPLHVEATDAAGNTTKSDQIFRIDQLKPTLIPTRTPAANALGWNNSLPVTVSWNIIDPVPPPQLCTRGYCQASGLKSVGVMTVADPASCPGGLCQPPQVTTGCPGACSGAPPTIITTEGKTHVIARAFDVAGNDSAVDAEVIVKPIQVDVTPPETYNQFDLTTKTNLVYARDAGSGVPSGPVKASSLSPARWTRDDNGDDDHEGDGEQADLRIYTIADAAGNTQTLTEKVHADDHEVHVDVLGFAYTTGCPTPTTLPGVGTCRLKLGIVPSGTTKRFEWSTNRDGSLREFEQSMTIGRGRNRTHVEATYDPAKKQTTIESDCNSPSKKTLPGQVLLRLATRAGGVVIEYTDPTTNKTVVFTPAAGTDHDGANIER